MVTSLKNFKITYKKLLSSLLNFVRVFEFAHSLIIRKFVTFISWQNWCSGSISGCDHRELGSNPVGGGKWRRSYDMEEEEMVEYLESERERWILWWRMSCCFGNQIMISKVSSYDEIFYNKVFVFWLLSTFKNLLST